MYKKLTWIVFAVGGLGIIILTWYLVSQERARLGINSQRDCDKVQALPGGGEYLPCSVLVNSKMSPSQMQAMAETFDGAIKTHLETIDFYTITVPFGSEQRAVDYLNSQPGVDGAYIDRVARTMSD